MLEGFASNQNILGSPYTRKWGPSKTNASPIILTSCHLIPEKLSETVNVAMLMQRSLMQPTIKIMDVEPESMF